MPLIIGGKGGEEASCWFEQQLAPAGTSGLRWFPLSTPSRGALPPVDPCLTLLLLYLTFKLLLIVSESKVKIRGFHLLPPVDPASVPCCLYLTSKLLLKWENIRF